MKSINQVMESIANKGIELSAIVTKIQNKISEYDLYVSRVEIVEHADMFNKADVKKAVDGINKTGEVSKPSVNDYRAVKKGLMKLEFLRKKYEGLRALTSALCVAEGVQSKVHRSVKFSIENLDGATFVGESINARSNLALEIINKAPEGIDTEFDKFRADNPDVMFDPFVKVELNTKPLEMRGVDNINEILTIANNAKIKTFAGKVGETISVYKVFGSGTNDIKDLKFLAYDTRYAKIVSWYFAIVKKNQIDDGLVAISKNVAHKGLAFTPSEPFGKVFPKLANVEFSWSNNVIIVDDVEGAYAHPSFIVGKNPDGTMNVTYDENHKFTVNKTDGGAILNFSYKGFNEENYKAIRPFILRGLFMKGLVTPFNVTDFMKDHGTDVIVDAYGVKHSVEDVMLIIPKSVWKANGLYANWETAASVMDEYKLPIMVSMIQKDHGKSDLGNQPIRALIGTDCSSLATVENDQLEQFSTADGAMLQLGKEEFNLFASAPEIKDAPAVVQFVKDRYTKMVDEAHHGKIHGIQKGAWMQYDPRILLCSIADISYPCDSDERTVFSQGINVNYVAMYRYPVTDMVVGMWVDHHDITFKKYLLKSDKTVYFYGNAIKYVYMLRGDFDGDHIYWSENKDFINLVRNHEENWGNPFYDWPDGKKAKVKPNKENTLAYFLRARASSVGEMDNANSKFSATIDVSKDYTADEKQALHSERAMITCATNLTVDEGKGDRNESVGSIAPEVTRKSEKHPNWMLDPARPGRTAKYCDEHISNSSIGSYVAKIEAPAMTCNKFAWNEGNKIVPQKFYNNDPSVRMIERIVWTERGNNSLFVNLVTKSEEALKATIKNFVTGVTGDEDKAEAAMMANVEYAFIWERLKAEYLPIGYTEEEIVKSIVSQVMFRQSASYNKKFNAGGTGINIMLFRACIRMFGDYMVKWRISNANENDYNEFDSIEELIADNEIKNVVANDEEDFAIL